MTEFDIKVFESLKKLGVDFSAGLRLGAAVSGGADSVCLLLSLCELSREYGFKLFVVNVNHNLREAGETDGDSAFVEDLCAKLSAAGIKLEFIGQVIPRGKLDEIAAQRGGGIEDAARSERYIIFERVIAFYTLDFLCLAHNQNDLLETALMRFLQGSFTEKYAIAARRGKFLRPLLGISRAEIEEYLRASDQKWRTDSTNSDDSYLRNNIRLNLLPLLDERFAGWKSGVLKGLEKSEMDCQLIEEAVEKAFKETECNKDSVLIPRDLLKGLSSAVKVRLLYKACNQICGEQRIPFAFIRDVCRAAASSSFDSKRYKNIEISSKNGHIIVKKSVKTQTDFTFSVIIEEEGNYEFDFGNLEVKKAPDGRILLFWDEKLLASNLTLPLLLRSALLTDEVETKDGSMKKVSDVFSDWHLSESERGHIPLVQELSSKNQRICCILGEVLGFDNWIVK